MNTCKFNHEGTCYNCGSPQFKRDCITPCKCRPPMTNFERIKAMSIDEMAAGITTLLTAHLNKYAKALGYDDMVLTAKEKEEIINEWKQVLESEVEE